MTEVIADELNREGGPKGVKLVALSGPTHAEDKGILYHVRSIASDSEVCSINVL